MKTLIIPDPHERLGAVQEALLAKHDRVVFLGDWFDTFKPWDEERIYSICSFIKHNVEHLPNATWLIGNHDVHYACPTEHYCCSGFKPESKRIIRDMLKPDVWMQFKVFTTVGPYTVSHAGFREETLQYAKPEVCELAWKRVINEGIYDALFGAGQGRGGRHPYGGPTWLDWNYEFYHMDTVPQIVGHTADSQPRAKGPHALSVTTLSSHCIDTHSKHYALVDEDSGEIEVKKL